MTVQEDHSRHFRRRTILIYIVALRLLNALSIKTFFQPDEYWQSLEPAHKLIYGYGWLTWEWKEHIRSAAHPLVFATVYKCVDYLGLSGTRAVVIAPKLIQAVIAAFGDYYTVKLAAKLLGPHAVKFALFASCASAFNWFCITRTFSNSLEMVLTTIGLYYWPWAGSKKHILSKRDQHNLVIALIVASLSCIFRPTNALLWGFLGLKLVVRTKSLKPVWLATAIGSLALALITFVDYWYFGKLVFPMSKFIAFNIYESLSQFYGVSPWHYYLLQGLPLLLIGYLPLVVPELILSYSSDIVQLVIFVVVTYSLLPHKEVRFIYPLMPLLHVLFSKALMRFDHYKTLRRRIVLATVLVNAPIALYFTLVHQRGVITVADYIRSDTDISQVGFLMPCHSTPWQSHIHRDDIDAWFLTCEPPIGLSREEQQDYLDEADQFYDHPLEFTRQKFADVGVPSHLVIFEQLEPVIADLLAEYGYSEDRRFFNSHFHDDWRRKGDVIVYSRA